MKHKKRWKPGGRPRPSAKTKRGNCRQAEKIKLRNMVLRGDELVFDEVFRLPAA